MEGDLFGNSAHTVHVRDYPGKSHQGPVSPFKRPGIRYGPAEEEVGERVHDFILNINQL
jgi:hypothetical protein